VAERINVRDERHERQKLRVLLAELDEAARVAKAGGEAVAAIHVGCDGRRHGKERQYTGEEHGGRCLDNVDKETGGRGEALGEAT
jgi:hypothetical protein